MHADSFHPSHVRFSSEDTIVNLESKFITIWNRYVSSKVNFLNSKTKFPLEDILIKLKKYIRVKGFLNQSKLIFASSNKNISINELR